MISVISCGPSGALWNGVGPSIGVNDCEKFGKPVDALVVVNGIFEPERMTIIQRHNGILYSSLQFWSNHPHFKPIETRKFKRGIQAGVIFHSITSPLIAISLAHVQGHREIVLYGVDFDSHPIVKGDVLSGEVDTYMRFIRELEKLGVSVHLGAGCAGVFQDKLPRIA